MNIEHISVSREKVWSTCELQYKFKYHLKIPPSGPEKPYFIYGKLVHKIFEEYIINQGKTSIVEISKNCLNGKIPLEESEEPQEPPIKSLPKSYVNKLSGHVKSFMKFVEKTGFEGMCEWRFRYDLDPPNDRCVFGLVDRLIFKDDKAFIIDYKTTQKSPWRTNKRNVTSDLQLQCYALMVMKHFGFAADKIRAALFFLEGEEIIGASFTKDTLETTEQRLLDVYLQIENMDSEQAQGKLGKHCDRCDFRTICPLYSLT